MSKELQRDAEVMVRRSERALGVAIREGQDRGEIETVNEGKLRGVMNREAARHDGLQEAVMPSKPRPRDYATKTELYGPRGGVMDMTDDVTDDEFEQAVTVARQEGNVSRANVVRKIKQAKAGPMDEPSLSGARRKIRTWKSPTGRSVSSVAASRTIIFTWLSFRA